MPLVDSEVDLGEQDKLSVLRVNSPQFTPPKLRNLNSLEASQVSQ